MFEPFTKISRLSRPIIITEKIDGSNAQLHIQTHAEFEAEHPEVLDLCHPYAEHFIQDDTYIMHVGSRKRWLGPAKAEDHFGLYKWAEEHFAELCLDLGPGRHYGEWWGRGIQRNYGLDEKRFSLFNTSRWYDTHYEIPDGIPPEGTSPAPGCCYVVPVISLYNVFATPVIDSALSLLRDFGSHAAPGFMNPEGVVIYHPHGNVLMKKTFKGDEVYDPDKKRAD